MKRYRVEFSVGVELSIDPAILPDDAWRKTFYPVSTMEDLAKLLAIPCGVREMDLSRMDGFADKRDDQVEVHEVEYYDFEIDPFD